jgi:hypothetical protein
VSATAASASVAGSDRDTPNRIGASDRFATDDVEPGRAERNARADLPRSLTHDVGHDPVDADDGEHQGRRCEHAKEPQRELRDLHRPGGGLCERLRVEKDRVRLEGAQSCLHRKRVERIGCCTDEHGRELDDARAGQPWHQRRSKPRVTHRTIACAPAMGWHGRRTRVSWSTP